MNCRRLSFFIYNFKVGISYANLYTLGQRCDPFLKLNQLMNVIYDIQSNHCFVFGPCNYTLYLVVSLYVLVSIPPMFTG